MIIFLSQKKTILETKFLKQRFYERLETYKIITYNIKKGVK